jgi:TonB-linked SusC/RagA family outer membrane protein
MLVVFLCRAGAQTATVEGTVTNDKGAPIAGASVMEAGTTNGTLSDAKGYYRLSIRQGASILVSYVGFSNKTIPTGNGGTLNIQLEPADQSLSEVVVTGTGAAISKKKSAFALETISSTKLPAAPTATVDQALVGKIPGALLSSINGNPGTPVNILLRGINSIQNGTMPMILLDGIEVKSTSLNTLDLNTVDRIEVVQGAAAATLYGAQGANGVIQLFSKRGKPGKVRIDVSTGFSVNRLINVNQNFRKARFHGFKTNDAGDVLGTSGNPLVFDSTLSMYTENLVWNSLDPNNNNNKPYNRNLKYLDHNDMFFTDATTYNNSIAISGAGERSDFNLSASDTRQESVFRRMGKYSRTNLVANLGIELAKNLRFRSVTQLAYSNSTLQDPTGYSILFALNNSRPFADYSYKMPDGNYASKFGQAAGPIGDNPNFQIQYCHPEDQRLDLVQNFSLNYRFLRFFEADVKYGLNFQDRDFRFEVDPQDDNLHSAFTGSAIDYYGHPLSWAFPQDVTESGEISDQQRKSTFQHFQPSLAMRLDFKNDFGWKLPVTSTTYGSFDYRKSFTRTYIVSATDAPSYSPYTAQNMLNFHVWEDRSYEFITYGYLFDQKFDYGSLAGIAAGFRTDYSSAFGSGSKPFTFPHVNGYFRLSALKFWDEGAAGNILPEMKFRAAYGEAGIQPGPFQRYVTLSPATIGTTPALAFPANSANPDLGVEVSHETEIGADLQIKGFKDAWFRNFNLSFTWWKRNTDNAMWNGPAPPTTGIVSTTKNLIGLESSGIQASLTMQVLSSKAFNWSFTTNFSKQASLVSSLKGDEIILYSSGGAQVLKEGEKIGQFYGYLMLHSVDQRNPETGEPFIPADQQPYFTVASNGWVVYGDPNRPNYKRPYVTPDRYSLGDPNPRFNMSFINDISYKGWLIFSMQWDWLSGSHIYNFTREWMYRDGIHGDFDKAFTVNKETGAWTTFYQGVYAEVSRAANKNYFYEDASFVRLRNISVGVDLARALQWKGIERVQLVFTGRNLITFTGYTGMDPEITSAQGGYYVLPGYDFFNSSYDRGSDHNTVPNIKSYQLTLNLGF